MKPLLFIFSVSLFGSLAVASYQYFNADHSVASAPTSSSAEVVTEQVVQVVESVPEGDSDVPVIVVEYTIEGSNYEYSLDEMIVAEGETVTVNFKSTDGLHDWVVDEFGASTSKVSEADGTTSVTFVADKAGSYEYYCSVGNHRAQGMVGTLIIK